MARTVILIINNYDNEKYGNVGGGDAAINYSLHV